MGILCVIKGFADPMYIVPSHESYLLHTKTESGNNDRDQDSGRAKHVHVPTGPDNAQIRMDNTEAPGRSMDSPRMIR
eukprot:4193794-Prorocentrum_lima.AAC.1